MCCCLPTHWNMEFETIGCYLIQWHNDSAALTELNSQIILCGLALLILPLFFISAVFKVRFCYLAFFSVVVLAVCLFIQYMQTKHGSQIIIISKIYRAKSFLSDEMGTFSRLNQISQWIFFILIFISAK